MHEAGLWARQLYPSLRGTLVAAALPAAGRGGRNGEGRVALPSEGSSSRRSGSPACSTTSATGRSPTSSTTTSWPRIPRRRTPPAHGKRLTHEDLSQLIIERELGDLIRGLRRAPGSTPERDGFDSGESIDPAWVAFLISKPALSDPAMPRWVRLLQPLLSGVFTVDNLDYVRRDAYLTGVSTGPVDAERLRRYSFIGPRGLTLYEPGPRRAGDVPHRAAVHVPAGLLPPHRPGDRPRPGGGLRGQHSGPLRDGVAGRCPGCATPTSTNTPCSTRPRSGRAGRGGRRPARTGRWEGDAGCRRCVEGDPAAPPALALRGGDPDRVRGRRAAPEALAVLGPAVPGEIAIDLAVVDARPHDEPGQPPRLAIEVRPGGQPISLDRALARLPAYALIARRFRRTVAPS